MSIKQFHTSLSKHIAKINDYLQLWAAGLEHVDSAKKRSARVIESSPTMQQNIESWAMVYVLSYGR